MPHFVIALLSTAADISQSRQPAFIDVSQPDFLRRRDL